MVSLSQEWHSLTKSLANAKVSTRQCRHMANNFEFGHCSSDSSSNLCCHPAKGCESVRTMKNSMFLPTHPCLVPLLRGNPSEFLDETYPVKSRGIGLLYGENCMILTSTVFDWSTHVMGRQTGWQTDRWTDRFAIAYSALTPLSMLLRVKNWGQKAA